MESLVECVPNFSEGSSLETLDAIADVIRGHARRLAPGPDG